MQYGEARFCNQVQTAFRAEKPSNVTKQRALLRHDSEVAAS